MKAQKIKRQLKAYGLNPKEWFVRLNNKNTAILIHQNIDDFVLVARMKHDLILKELNMMTL